MTEVMTVETDFGDSVSAAAQASRKGPSAAAMAKVVIASFMSAVSLRRASDGRKPIRLTPRRGAIARREPGRD